jgi:peptidoglycan/xylan/chitin deacetylase (PgdA/CDA1 family)/uncharacterized caspase-like protein
VKNKKYLIAIAALGLLALTVFLVLKFALRGSFIPPIAVKPQPGETLSAAALDDIVTSYRKIIVLLDGEESLSGAERSRCTSVGRRIYAHKQQLLNELSQNLEAEFRKAVATQFQEKPKNITGFINYLATNSALRDADRLAFVDLADELLSLIREESGSPNREKAQLQEALQKLNDELASIQSAYREEVARIFSRFQTRGQQTRREKWEDYVAFLKKSLEREQILSEYARDESDESYEQTRGAKRDSKLEIYGYDLPAKSIALTFDDGPHRKYTEEVLAILKKYNARACFFEVGKNLGAIDDRNNVTLSKTAAVTKKILESGHALANHSYSHPQLTKLPSAERNKEIIRTNTLLEKIIGAKPKLFRPPYGSKNADVLKDVESQGMKSVMWNIDSLDWADPIPESIAQRVLNEIHGAHKGVLLMHDIHKQTVAALPRILEELAKEGYTFAFFEDGKLVQAPPKPAEVTRASTTDAAAPDRSAAASSKKGYYRESWAVVIGINEYQRWPKLRYSVNDANSVEEILVSKFKFKKSNVIKLLNQEATRQKIVSVLGDDLAGSNKVGKDDRVFVFFAGHGVTRKAANGKEFGYIVPVDADQSNYQATAISMTNLRDFCELIPAKHIYFVMDSCYSGLALTRSAASKNYLDEITNRIARQILTAGGADEQVADGGPSGHSIFTWTLLQGLQGLADMDGNGVITASELGAYVAPIVAAYSKQTPAFGNLVGSEGGEFVFELQYESLTDVSKQLDEEAIKLNEELDLIRKEIAAKRERNAKLRQKVQEEMAKLPDNGPGPAGGVTRAPAASAATAEPRTPKSKRAQAQKHHAVGLQYYREKKYDLAAQELEQAVKLDPANATIANNMGHILYRLDRNEEALAWLQKTIQLDPKRAVAYVNIADVYKKLGRNQEAKENYEKYLQLVPESSRAEEIRQKIKMLE